MMSNRLGIVLFGATGFTGSRIVPILSRLINCEGLSLTWGIAGRSERKLRAVLRDAGKQNGGDFDNIPVIVADTNNEDSLIKLTSSTKVLINAVGPYRFYGEAIVKACITTSTHYVDITGEPEFMEKMQLHYHEEAKKKGTYIISACGIDSIPADLGAIFMMKNFDGTLNSIEAYISMIEDVPCPGPLCNYTTWVSAVHSVSNYEKLVQLRSQLFCKELPQCRPKVRANNFFKNKVTGKWSIPFPGADRAVMQRTQRYLYEMNNERPIQVHCYYDFEKKHNALLAILLRTIFSNMCKYQWSRSLLLKYPRLFSLGVFTLEGPSDEKCRNTTFHLYLEGKGWHQKVSVSDDQSMPPPDKRILVKVTAKDATYGATSVAAALSAITILMENEKMPNGGGCITPGIAFRNTSLLEKLNKYGMKFEIYS